MLFADAMTPCIDLISASHHQSALPWLVIVPESRIGTKWSRSVSGAFWQHHWKGEVVRQKSSPGKIQGCSRALSKAKLYEVMPTQIKTLISHLSSHGPDAAVASCKLIERGEAAVDALIEVLGGFDPRAYLAAERCLLFIGEPAFAPLIEACRSENTWLRHRAAETLGRFRDNRAVETLIELLSDGVSDVRVKSAEALGRICDARAAEPLINMLMDRSATVRAAAATALGNIDADMVVGPLIEAVADTRMSVSKAACSALTSQRSVSTTPSLLAMIQNRRSLTMRREGIRILGERRDQGAVQALIVVLANSVAEVRVAAATQLGIIEATESIDALIEALLDSSALVRRAAAVALGGLRSRKAVEPLIALLNDPEQTVLDAAAIALRQIGDPKMADAMLRLLDTASGEALEQAIRVFGEMRAPRALATLTRISQSQDKRVESDGTICYSAQQALKLYGIQSPGDRLSSSFVSLAANFGGINKLEADTTYALSGADLSHRTEVFATRPREEALTQAVKDLNGDDSNLQSIAADALGKMGGDEAVDALLAALEKLDCSGYGFRHTVDALGRIGGDRAVHQLLAFAARSVAECSDTNIGHIANALGKLGGARVVDTLITLTRSSSNYVRGEAITALQVIGDARAVPAFIETLQADGNKIRRIQAAAGLAQFADPVAAEPLRTALFDPEPRVRAAAANALGRLGDAAAAPTLERMVEVEEDQAARTAAEEALLA